MTEQLERDLSQLFHQRADEMEIPPIPVGLVAVEEDRSPWRRRALAIGLVAAAAVAAIAVPIGLADRGGDDNVAPVKDPVAQQGFELPYVLDGELHVGDLTLPVQPNSSLQIAGSTLLVARSENDGSNVQWQRLAGKKLEALPYLDGLASAIVSYDGTLVAAATDAGDTTSLRLWDTDTGAVVETFELDTQPFLDQMWLWGFDEAGNLYWQDGTALKARTSAGAVVTIDIGSRQFAGIAPGGLLLRNGNSDTLTIGTVSDDGSVSLGAKVPVSSNAAWRDATTVAYQRDGDGRLFVLDITTGDQSEITVPGKANIVPTGWSGDDLVVTAYDDSNVIDVLAVDPATGEQSKVFSFGTDQMNPFGVTGGLGAL